MEQIVQNLEKDGSAWAKEVLEDLDKASPLSLKVTFELLKRGKSLSLPDCLTMEYRLSQNILQHKDFYIGIRARKFYFFFVTFISSDQKNFFLFDCHC